MSVKPLPYIDEIAPYRPGDSKVPGVAHPVKLASNENPFGSSPKAKAAYAGAVDSLAVYPEGTAADLRRAIAARYGLDAERIVCGSGSDEIFFMLGRAYLGPGDEMVQSEHAFSIYQIVGRQSGAVIRTAKNKSYAADVDAMLACVTSKTKIVWLDNPNNPTGTYIPYSEVKRLHAALPPDVLLVIDAAYAEYVQANDYSAGMELAGEAGNVIMTRTFSKIYGLAALRLGWAYGPSAVVEALHKVRGPFNVSTPAQAAGVAAIEDQAFADMSAEHNARELPRVTARLRALGLDVTPSVGNFVLVHFTNAAGKTVDAVDTHLRQRGYILRRVTAYGLPNALRLSIGTTEQNDGVLSAFAELFS